MRIRSFAAAALCALLLGGVCGAAGADPKRQALIDREAAEASRLNAAAKGAFDNAGRLLELADRLPERAAEAEKQAKESLRAYKADPTPEARERWISDNAAMLSLYDAVKAGYEAVTREYNRGIRLLSEAKEAQKRADAAANAI